MFPQKPSCSTSTCWLRSVARNEPRSSEARVVELLVQVLDRTIGRELELEPRKQIAGRRPALWSGQATWKARSWGVPDSHVSYRRSGDLRQRPPFRFHLNKGV